jgi:hypothetical protein
MAEGEEKPKSTLDSLDALLGIEPELEEKPTPRAPPTPPAVPPPSPVVKPLETSDVAALDISDKVLSSVVYLLPLLDGLRYSKFLLAQYPQFALLLAPLQPLIQFYYGLGFLNIGFFFAIYLGVSRNQSLSRYIRFNASQAVVLDILLILPDVVNAMFTGINGPPTGGPMLELKILFNNTAFFFVYFSACYGALACLAGKEPRLPLVSEAADRQSGGGMR